METNRIVEHAVRVPTLRSRKEISTAMGQQLKTVRGKDKNAIKQADSVVQKQVAVMRGDLASTKKKLFDGI